MQQMLRRTAVVVALLATVAATVMRIVLAPQMQSAGSGAFHPSYAVIAVLVAALAVVLALVLLGREPIPRAPELPRGGRLSVAWSSLFAGAVLTATTLFDGWMWMFHGTTPAPNSTVISPLDGGALTLSMIFGIVGGLFLLWLGAHLLYHPVRRSGRLALAALAPVAWIWFRLVRYELSYASAVQVSQSFYDFMMFIFTMLFLFAFARYVSGTGEKSPKTLLFYALGTAMLSLSGVVTGVMLYYSGEAASYGMSNLANMADLGMGVFGLCVAVSLAFTRPLPVEETAREESGAELAAPSVDPDTAAEETLPASADEAFAPADQTLAAEPAEKLAEETVDALREGFRE